MLPGPQSYLSTGDMAMEGKFAKSILGGAIEGSKPVDNGNPGPGAHNLNPLNSIPGFIMFDLNKITKPWRNEADRERR